MARSAPREPYLELASVCILRDRQPDVIDPRSKAFRDVVAGDLPVWLDFNLHTKTGRWIDPWMSLSDERVRGDGFEEILDILRAEGRFDATAELTFKSLPDLNELGVARMLKRALGPEGTRSALYPLIGFIPTSTLDKASPSPAEQQLAEDSLEFALLRVNLAVVGNLVMTIRLPDRLCSGSRAVRGGDRRLPASASGRVPANLAVFPHLLSGGHGSGASDMADALALYLSATSVSVAEYVRRALFPIECEVRNSLNGKSDSEDPTLLERYGQVFDLRMTLALAEEEMRRLLQRLSEGEFEDDDPGRSVQLSYSKALDEICALEQDLRITGDGLATRLEEQRQAAADDRHKQVSTLIGGIGALLVLPALVATLFNEDAKLPKPHSGFALAAMLGSMIAVGALGWWAFDRLRAGGVQALKRPPNWLSRTRALRNGVLGGLLALLAALAFYLVP